LDILNKFQDDPAIVDAGFNNGTLRSAIGLFIYNYMKIQTKRAKISKYLCANDDVILNYVYLIHRLFPNAKFLFIIKDGRQTARSMLEGKDANLTKPLFRSYIRSWFSTNFYFKSQCNSIGEQFCRLFRYEDLISDTKKTLKSIYKFLDLSLSNEQFVYHSIYISDRVAADRGKKCVYSTEYLFKNLKSYDKISYMRISKFLGLLNYNILDVE
jgi:protein-tyrosine sulfotransferase